jgi:hypothetical protein
MWLPPRLPPFLVLLLLLEVLPLLLVVLPLLRLVAGQPCSKGKSFQKGQGALTCKEGRQSGRA